MAERDPALLRARGLGVRFGAVQALRDVDLDIAAGQCLVVLGANGAGKSVLLRALHGLVEPTEGTIDGSARDARRHSQAMVFQRPVMLRRSALANIEYALAVNGIPMPQRQTHARNAIRRVGLAHLADRQARVLSGGEQQRIALARAWALDPLLLVLDEPTASLDPSAATEVERVMREIHQAGTTVVMSTHNLGLARRIAGAIVFLHEGRLAEVTPADRFFAAPASREAAQFLEGELPWTAAR
jgi:tungstate transport system ATP-binding protein